MMAMAWERIAENRIRDAMQAGSVRRELADRRARLAVLLGRTRRT